LTDFLFFIEGGKTMKKHLLILAASSLFVLSACGGAIDPVSQAPASSTGLGTSSATSVAPKEFTGLIFADQSVVYDGTKHSLSVTGLPEGAAVVYSGQDYLDVGSYPVVATVSKEGYITKTLQATLTITEADLTAEKVASLGLALKDATYPYDAESHRLQITGDVPAGTSVSYTIDGQEGNAATEVGEHAVVAMLKIPNYHAYTLTATLKIVAVERILYSTMIGSSVLFQNDLDSDSLYCYDASLKKLSYDVMGGFSSLGSMSFGIVKSLWGKAVVSYTKDAEGNLKKSKLLAGTPLEAIAAVDTTHFYYSIKNLLVNKTDNGLYLFDTSKVNDDYRGEKILADVAPSQMLYDNGRLYFIDDEKRLNFYDTVKRVRGIYDLNGNIYELALKDGYLYYNKGDIAAKGLYRTEIATNKEEQLTIDNGTNLTIIGNDLYYVNKDLLTATLFGKGIYKVPLDGSLLNASGTPVVLAEDDKIGSLASDGTSLYYYRFNTAHFFKNNAAGTSEVDLMADFVKPEDTTLVGRRRQRLCRWPALFRQHEG
jgi:hypothetical protein